MRRASRRFACNRRARMHGGLSYCRDWMGRTPTGRQIRVWLHCMPGDSSHLREVAGQRRRVQLAEGDTIEVALYRQMPHDRVLMDHLLNISRVQAHGQQQPGRRTASSRVPHLQPEGGLGHQLCIQSLIREGSYVYAPDLLQHNTESPQ